MSNARSAALWLAASVIFLAGLDPASAFSQLGRQDGTLPEQGSVLQSPLPPLSSPPAADPAKPEGAADDAPVGATDAPAAGPASPSGPVAPGVSPSAGDASSPAATVPDRAGTPATAIPQGDTTEPASGDAGEEPEEGIDPQASQQAMPEQPQGPPPDVVYGDAELPAAVRELRAKLIEIAKSGDIEKLRPYVEPGEDGTVLSFGGVEGDPIAFLKSASGDGEGVETLAILLEILQSGHIRNEPGTDNEIYVWPYFSGLAIDKLTKPQKVELFELITAGDYQEMVGFGAYNFYRVGISPDGKLQFFVAGD